MTNNQHKMFNLIIDGAKKLFLAKGFDGTSVRDIAKECNINKSLIYHHFESKEALWRAVKGRMLENYLNSVREVSFTSTSTLLELITSVVTMRFNLYDQNPDLVRMVTWQRLEDSHHDISGVNDARYNNVIEVIKRLQEDVVMRIDITPEFASYFIFSNAVSVFVDRYEEVINASSEEKEEYMMQIIDFLYRALRI